ncbi:Cellulose synthase-like protein G3 [Morella rubra]|uniref:Cellulose synthase-like protein G3 n=1 Tax=Morella rubra TaxID=262757 RepID=A0A6A1VV72_9ROSI|nr:Cellulose synthase-like protein G3 [Morella rubra]
MDGVRGCSTTTNKATNCHTPHLHTLEPSRLTVFNRVFAAAYSCAILVLLCHHVLKLIHSTTLAAAFISLALLISDLLLALIWAATQPFRLRPIHRKEFPENLGKVVKESDYLALDVFICTADPYKEPPLGVANTALSVMAYDYPTEKISVYVSDDGGSQLTLFAFMEAAKFARHWLPFCRQHNVVERSPEAYFTSNNSWTSEAEKIKTMYDSMKIRVENVVERGKLGDEYITGEEERRAFSKWTDGFTRQEHPTVIQVLLENSKDKDITDHFLPNLIYVSRQKSRTSPHNFKAGALNVLLRVSATMTNAPIILTLDCDMCSNDPITPLRVLCYLFDPQIRSKQLGYIQFPQHFHGINKNDTYAGEFKRLFQINPVGLDGLSGPTHVGTGCFFCRRAFFGGPSTLLSPEVPALGPYHVVDRPIRSQPVMELAHKVAGCNYENQTKWGSEIGVRYGSLVEDYYTGYRLQCEGWTSIFCNPKRPAFLGDAPITLVDVLNQQKRWAIGLLEVGFSKFSPITFGIRSMGLLMGLAYAQIGFWAIWSIPITVYSFLPQLALLNGFSIFPLVSESWFLLYIFLFLGAYGQDFLDFVLSGGTVQRWWNDQRIWMIRGLTCYLFGLVEFSLKSIGISTQGFNVTSKVLDDEQSKRYEQGLFEFGVPSPMFVPLTIAAIINLVSLVKGLMWVLLGRSKLEGLFVQLLIAGIGVVNCWPIYEAMVLRSDKGRMPLRTTIISTFLASGLLAAASLLL